MPPARRNNDRRRRRAARAASKREERRLRELERRRQEREQARAERAASGQPEPVTPPPVSRATRPEPPDLPGLDRLDASHAARRAEHEPVSDEPAAFEPAAFDEPPAPIRASAPGSRMGSAMRSAGGSARRAGSAVRSGAAARVATGSAANRRRVVVRHVDPWSVFKLSLVLYFCLLIVVTLGLVIFWLVLSRMGPMRSMLESIEQMGMPIDPGLVLTVMVPVGVLNVLVWSAANLFFAVLYNLVADLVGGLRITLSHEDR